MRAGTQMEAPRCLSEKRKGDRRTLQTYVYVCDLPEGHDGSHEGVAEGQAAGLAWPQFREEDQGEYDRPAEYREAMAAARLLK